MEEVKIRATQLIVTDDDDDGGGGNSISLSRNPFLCGLERVYCSK